MSRATIDELPLPLAIRAFNVARGLLGLAFRRDFDEARLLARARRITGLEDFGDDAFWTPLRRLLRALDEEAGLSGFGRSIMGAHVVRSLAGRLRVEDWLRRCPEIGEARVVRPLFIVGYPRSGTTHLHHLLCADDRVCVPSFWKLRAPTPPPDRRVAHDPRIRRAERAIARGLSLTPQLSRLHAQSATAPEECHFLLDLAFMNPLLPAGSAYDRWWQKQDLTAAYRYHARLLALLQWRWPGDHWVLKGAFHLWHLDALVRVYPDACFVFTHRAPEQVFPSAASYASVRARAFFDQRRLDAIGPEIADALGRLMSRGLEHRRSLAAERFVDVAFEDIVTRPVAVAERVAARFGYRFDDRSREAVGRHAAAHPRHRHGVHRYDCARFGITPDALGRATQEYRDFARDRGISLLEP
ncbi:MAG: sulfotransferase [Polyangiaceae bacterium]|nr:sulfotransferase [Polyangiaceae bacterium]